MEELKQFNQIIHIRLNIKNGKSSFCVGSLVYTFTTIGDLYKGGAVSRTTKELIQFFISRTHGWIEFYCGVILSLKYVYRKGEIGLKYNIKECKIES